jgi:riboflavin kinase/FMN adenylyltransferase
MQHFASLDDARLDGAWLTIGSFDGVHLGHQAILRQLAAGAQAAGAPAIVLTFHPHPAAVLRGRNGPYYLTAPDERAELIAQLGIDFVITQPFDRQLADQSARDFIKRLVDRLGIRHLFIGRDFALGRGREGDLPTLQRLGKEFDFTVNVIRPIRRGGEVVSSSRIRSALSQGDVATVRRLLGRPYMVNGLVVTGDGRGRTIGIPTANLDTWEGRLLPKVGVYACVARLGERTWRAVANIGLRPTFDQQSTQARLETHLLDFSGDLYGRQVALSFLAHLRDEQRFPDAHALVQQIQQDIHRSRQIIRLNHRQADRER